MIKVERFVNQLMSSNCFVVYDDETNRALVIDPGNEKSEQEIFFIQGNQLNLDYIILTHEHTDHTWGVNALLEKYPSTKVVCSSSCRDALSKEARAYFQFYFDEPDYIYNVERVDYTTEELNWHIEWCSHQIAFIPTPGHSPGSVCIVIDEIIFGGDTLMPFKPFIKKRNGGSMEQFQESVKKMIESFPAETFVYPGHGEGLRLNDLNCLDWYGDRGNKNNNVGIELFKPDSKGGEYNTTKARPLR